MLWNNMESTTKVAAIFTGKIIFPTKISIIIAKNDITFTNILTMPVNVSIIITNILSMFANISTTITSILIIFTNISIIIAIILRTFTNIMTNVVGKMIFPVINAILFAMIIEIFTIHLLLPKTEIILFENSIPFVLDNLIIPRNKFH